MIQDKLMRTVLIVDDEPNILTAIEDVLCLDFHVITDTSPVSAIKHLENEKNVSVIISDQRMPDWSGHQFLSQAREISDATRLLITGYSDTEAIVSAVNGGKIFGYIPKPWKAGSLKMIVSQAAEHCEMLRALTEEQRLLRSLMNSVRDPIYFKNREHHFLRGNQGVASLLGVKTPDELIGRTIADFLPREDALRIVDEDEGIMSQGTSLVDALVSMPQEDGEPRWLSVSKVPLRDEQDAIIGLVGFARDITKRKLAEEALQESQEQARTVIFSALDAFVIFDRDGSIIDWNPQATVIFGWSRADVLGQDFADTLLAPQFRQVHRDAVARFLAIAIEEAEGPVGNRLEWSAVDRAGREFPIEFSLSPLPSRNGVVFSAFIRDATTRKEQEAKIVRLTRIYAVLSEINSAIVRIRQRNDLFAEACRIVIDAGRFGATWIALLNADTGTILPVVSAGIAQAQLPPADEDGVARQALRQMTPVVCNTLDVAPPGNAVEGVSLASFGSVIALPLVVDGVPIGVQVLYAREPSFFDDQEIALLRDMAGNLSFALEHIAKAERLDYLAFYDGLTGLPNRTLFTDRLTQQIQAPRHETRKLALVLLDLERFRNVNETLGLSAGDALLKQVAGRLEAADIARENLSRINGDCFGVVILDVKTEAEVAHVAQQVLLPCFARPFSLSGQDVHISAVMGIALYPSDGSSAESLFSNAEIMLKRAKHSGDRFLFYAPGMNVRVAQQLHLETRLRKALETEQFVLHYQPKIDLRGGQITGFEALIRWQDPSGALIPPGDFIPVLEETGLIIDVGKWALERAASDYGHWLSMGFAAPRIAVNLSAIQLRRRDFVKSITHILETKPHARDCLDLEITESVLMEDIQSNIKKLQEVKNFGVRISVDDFGTGYSSLSYIAKLPIDMLKIDRLFITNMAENPDDLTIVTTIISLGHSLNLKVIAEGVETEEQAKFLRLLRCDEMQGYLYSKPLPADDILAHFRTSSFK